MPSHLVTKKMLSVSEQIKILEGECLAALLSHTNLSSCKRTLSADGSVSLQYATEAKQFPSFPTGHQLPLQAVPQRLLPLVLPRKDLQFLGTTTCPVSPSSAALTPAGTPRPLSRAPRGVGPPHRPDSARAPPEPCAGTRGRALFPGTPREGEPQPRRSRGPHGPGRARPLLGGAPHTHTHTHTQNTRLAPVRCYRRAAKSHPAARRCALRGGTSAGIPLPGHSRVTTGRHADVDKQEKDGEESSPLPLP
ncbi:PREDICTED: uncharacterized protein LOC101808854 [Ficedula albicollis]|uniref:uncharacterized protein LOC101808854 n=1 Tax=Ficedula albicollis TaxID=59894 RepID=UPI000359AEED|nr:PREDICTED: uncharacterized protein LOC101808854 [Ficedula albicollis]